MGNGEWGVGSGEGNCLFPLPTPNSTLPIPTPLSELIKDTVLRRACASALSNAGVVDFTAYYEVRIAGVESLHALVTTG